MREVFEAEAEKRPKSAGKGLVFRLEKEGFPNDPVPSSLVLLRDVVPDKQRNADTQRPVARHRYAGLNRRVEFENRLELLFTYAQDVN